MRFYIIFWFFSSNFIGGQLYFFVQNLNLYISIIYIYIYIYYKKKKVRCPHWSKVSIPILTPHLAHWKSLSLFLLKTVILEKRDERKIRFLAFYVMSVVGPMNFKIFTIILLNIVAQTLKTAMNVISKYSV